MKKVLFISILFILSFNACNNSGSSTSSEVLDDNAVDTCYVDENQVSIIEGETCMDGNHILKCNDGVLNYDDNFINSSTMNISGRYYHCEN